MAVSLKQIAEASDVSIATVSRVLRGRGEIAPATRRRVQQAADQLRYRPNLLVKGMQTGKTQSFGVLMAVGDTFYSKVLVGIQNGLDEHDCVPIALRVMKGPDGYEGPTELQQIHRLVDRRVDGVILRPVEDAASDEYLKEVWDRGLPLVAIDRQLPHSHADFVGTDDRDGARQAAEHLLELGHRSVAQIAGPRFASTGRDRADGFEQAIAEHPNTKCITVIDQSFVGGEMEAASLLSGTDRPTAIFCGNDMIADKVSRTALAMGLSIPKDLSIVGFGDLDFASWMTPALTTVRQDALEIGYRAANLVWQRAHDQLPKDEVQAMRVPAELIVRESTSTPAR